MIKAKGGLEAVEMVIRERPDLILVVVNMPGMNRLAAGSKIWLSRPSLRTNVMAQVLSFICVDGQRQGRDSIREHSRAVPQEFPSPALLYVSAQECALLVLAFRVPA